MAKTRSKKPTPRSKGVKALSKKPKVRRFFYKATKPLRKLHSRFHTHREAHLHPHKSFHRSYREDYTRPVATPGLISHAVLTFKFIFQKWRVFLPFILLMTLSYIIAVGLLSEEVYVELQDTIEQTSGELAGGKIGNFAKSGLLLFSTITTGGLDTGMGETQKAFMIILFLVMWLVTLYLVRHFFAQQSPKLRDGLYNALAPLISTLVVFIIMFLQAMPVIILAIAYSAALTTDFLATPFYALVFFVFAAIMLLISGYLWSSSIVALIAVTTPGMYPLHALFAASDLMSGRRIRILIRLFYLCFVIIFTYIIMMLPIVWFDLWLKSVWTFIEGLPIVPFFLLLTTCFVFIYLTVYLYQYYRWILDFDNAGKSTDESKIQPQHSKKSSKVPSKVPIKNHNLRKQK